MALKAPKDLAATKQQADVMKLREGDQWAEEREHEGLQPHLNYPIETNAYISAYIGDGQWEAPLPYLLTLMATTPHASALIGARGSHHSLPSP